MEWQDISTAPKDGTRLYGVRYVATAPTSLYFVSTIYWQDTGDGDGIWMTEDWNEVEEPTHWAAITPPAS